MKNLMAQAVTAFFATWLLQAAPVNAADFQQGLRLKADNKLEAAAAEFEGVVQQQPNDVKALEQLAVVQGWLGRHEASIATWRRLIALDGQREDARIGIARVQYWARKWPAALQTLDDVLSRQPKSADALALKGDVLLAQQMPGAARESYQLALQNGGDATELQKKLSRAVEPKRWRLDVGVGRDRYTNSRGSEYSSFVQLGYAVSPELTVFGRNELVRQFGTNDNTVYGGAYWVPSPDLLLFGEVGATPSPNFRPQSQVLLGAEFLGNATIQPLLSYRYARYDGTSVNVGAGAVSGKGAVKTITPGVRLVLPNAGNLELRYAFSNNIDGSNTKVGQVRLGFDAGPQWAPYVAYFKGDEALPPQAAASFKTYVAGTTYQIDDAWSLRADFSYEDRPQFYKRRSLSAGVSYRF